MELGRTSFRRLVQLFFWVFSPQSSDLTVHSQLSLSSLFRPLHLSQARDSFLGSIRGLHRFPQTFILPPDVDPQPAETLWKTNKHQTGTQISCLAQGQRHARMPRLTAHLPPTIYPRFAALRGASETLWITFDCFALPLLALLDGEGAWRCEWGVALVLACWAHLLPVSWPVGGGPEA